MAGLCTVHTKITSPDLTTETFHRWYKSHIVDDIIKLPGIPAALRWKTLAGSERPWLASYPVQSVEVFREEGWNSLVHHSDILPPPHNFVDLMDFDTRYYKIVDKHEGTADKNATAKFVEWVAFTPGGEADFDKWYKDEFLPSTASAKGYLRTFRYKLAYAEDNVDVVDPNTVPSILLYNEFESEARDAVSKILATDQAQKIFKSAKLEQHVSLELIEAYHA
ncbi:hypothetical protein FOMG_17188 [Fusarium oxysporum f. sp. melonis 26406]|uniref:EthD domain-containing protein n=1 Tax=Fusarium oxysporum f. sp. melonis 26406 TaxID=1089452 RepID=W9ZD75_FUSOX|nr:hypothetical protein FOMG_17188 [Fusarium oxysporum f. sp. melonis 26406]